jgi:DNA replication protein DnaC
MPLSGGRSLARCEALSIDDLGHVRQDRDETGFLFTLPAERYERGSLLIASQLPFLQCGAIPKDPMTTAAAIDRLVHHSIVLQLSLSGYRTEQAKRSRREPTPRSWPEV